MRLSEFTTLFLLFSVLLLSASAEQCGSQAGGALCASGLCCSKFGWCGNTNEYCGPGNCQSQCSGGPGPSGDLGGVISNSMFDQMLNHRNDNACQGKNNFYSYNAFVTAAGSFPGFGTTGDITARKREVAAFLAQTSHETTGGWPTAPDGPYAWGYCFLREQGSPGDYCTPSSQWPCAPGRKYFGRGPIQISHNYNYGPCGRAIGVDLLNNPDLVATDPVISFKSAIWFWMTPQSPKPSCHDVITGNGNHLALTKQLIASLDSVSSQTSSMVAWNVVTAVTAGSRIGLGFTGGIAEFLELAQVTILIAAIRGLLETDS